MRQTDTGSRNHTSQKGAPMIADPNPQQNRQAEETHSDEAREMIRTFFGDLRFTFRQLRSNPGFAIISVLTLALGIGASTAIFSAVNPILFEPLPYPHADRLTTIWEMRK